MLVANRPRLIRELVLATIADQPDIDVVGELQNDAEVLPAIEQVHPDFLILTLEDCDRRPRLCGEILEKYPRLKILAVASERDSTIFYWASLQVHSNSVETSEKGVLDALRSVAAPAGGEK